MKNSVKFFISLCVLVSLSYFAFSEESSKKIKIENSVYTGKIDGRKISIYFCNDGYALMDDMDEYIVVKYVFNEKANMGALFQEIDQDNLIIFFVSSDGQTFTIKDPDTKECYTLKKKN